MSNKDRLVADDTLALSKAQDTYDPEKHAAKFKAQKQVQRTVMNLRKSGRANGAMQGSEQNQQLATQLFNFADRVENRQSFLDLCNTKFQDTVLSKLTAKNNAAL